MEKRTALRDYSNVTGTLISKKVWQFPLVKTKGASRTGSWQIYVGLCPANTMPDTSKTVLEQLNLWLEITSDIRANDLEAIPANAVAWIKVETKADVSTKFNKSEYTFVTKGKSIGKKNETNLYCQALTDANSKYENSLKRNTLSSASDLPAISPMLAKVFSGSPRTEIYLQPKLNGVRATAFYSPSQDTVIFASRMRMQYPNLSVLQNALLPILRTYWTKTHEHLHLDGELYIHGESLQNITSRVTRLKTPDVAQPAKSTKSKTAISKTTTIKTTTSKSINSLNSKPQNADNIQYHIFDLYIEEHADMPFGKRYALLQDILSLYAYTGEFAAGLEDPNPLRVVETYHIMSDKPKKVLDIANRLYRQWLTVKLEGAMIRYDTRYVLSINNSRSDGLMKLKPRLDAEFPIIGWREGDKGKTAGALILICAVPGHGALPDGEFSVIPALEISDRMAWVKKFKEDSKLFKNEWLDRLLVVHYDELSKDGIPLRATTAMDTRDARY